MRLRRVCEQKNANEESRRAGTLAMSRSFFFHFFLIDYNFGPSLWVIFPFPSRASGELGGDKIERAPALAAQGERVRGLKPSKRV